MSGIINSAGSRSGVIGTTELDYEEGTWTLVDDSAGFTFSSVTQENSYVKIGKMVHISFRQTGGTISQTDTYQILSGLPFPAVRAHMMAKMGHHGTPYKMDVMLYQGQLQKILFFRYLHGSDTGNPTNLTEACFNLVYETT